MTMGVIFGLVALALGVVVVLRTEVVYRVRIRYLNMYSDNMNALFADWAAELNECAWSEVDGVNDKYRTSLQSMQDFFDAVWYKESFGQMMFMFTKWTVKQFYSDICVYNSDTKSYEIRKL